jgi:processing peptidase subunit beta
MVSTRALLNKPLLSKRWLSTASNIVSQGIASTKVTTLPNGLRVATESIKHLPTCTVGMWIDTGSRYETELNNGTAHFLEHMTFKGTGKRSQTDIELEFENMGGHLNAYTSREQTCFFAKVLSGDMPKAVDILADILQNSKLDSTAIERERDVILREQEEVNKHMEEVVMDHLHTVAYQGTPLARTILGTTENIQTINKKHLEDYIRKNYAAERMVLAAAGGVDHDALVRIAEQAFSKLPATTAIMKPQPARYTGSEVRMRDDSMETAHVVIALQGASFKNPDYFPLLVAQTIVGQWDRTMADGHYLSSRLAQQVAQSQLAHSFTSFNTSYTDTGLWGIYFVSDKKYELDDLVYLIQSEWVRLCLNVTDAEVERAKSQIKTSMMLSLDGTTPIAEDIGRQLLIFGKRYTLQEMQEFVDAVTTDTVKRVCSEYLYDRCPVISAFGPIESLPDYNRIRAATMWLRN